MKKISSYAIILIGIFLFYQNTPVYAAGPTIVTKDITVPTTWTKSGSPYVIKPQFETLYVSSHLTIEPGVVVKFYNLNKNLSIGGSLTAIGTPEENIVFTSYKDDTFGGDTNNDGSRSVPQKGDWYAIINSGLAVFDNTTVLYGSSNPGTGAIFSYSNNLTVRNSTIQYAAYSGIALYNAPGVTIENNIITNNSTGISIASFISGTSTKISHNVIANNNTGAWVFGLIWWKPEFPLDARDNWWGDASGPKHLSLNPLGKGNPVGDGILFNPQLDHDPFVIPVGCTSNCYSNVMFLPGVEASRLYIDNKKVWEPGNDTDTGKLYLDGNGKSIRNDIYTKDVIDNAYIPAKGNIYKSFLADLNTWKNTDKLITDYSVAPYDWRLSLDDILNNGTKTGDNISYIGSTNTPYIVGELQRLASTSKSGKVTLIAHSNGGLVAKALIQKLGAVEVSRLIDKIVFVAVPQTGTPKAIGAILHGYDQGLPVDWWPFALTPKIARTLAQNMLSAYTLLPSDAYFRGEGSGVTTPVITFEPGASTQPFIDNYGNNITSSAEMQSFLTNTTGKVSADSSDIVSPSKVNFSLLADSKNTHQTLDNLTIPSSISVYQIAGFGQETLGTIKYWTGEECLHEGGKICSSRVPKLEYTPELIADGDGTVVAPSALAMSIDATNISRWWVDLGDYNKWWKGNIRREHSNILEISQLRDFVKNNILSQSVTTLPNYLSISEPPVSSEKRLRYYLHSPLTLSAHDSQGNVISAENDTYPGAEYQRFGEVQYISLPAESHPTVVLDGQAEGSFTLEVQEVTGDTITEKTTFSAIPTSSDTIVTIDFPDGTVAGASPLAVDYNGDGVTDFSLASKPGETVVFDITPPTTVAQAVGTSGTNDWYTSDVIMTLTAQDETNGTGVAKTEYSTDSGAHWNTYVNSFILSDEGTTTIQYFSTDKQGNKEEIKTQSIKIDKTAPEVKVVFNPITQKLDSIGTDNLSQNVSVTRVDSDYSNIQTKSVTSVTDEAGHITILTLNTSKDKEWRIVRTLESIAYDGVITSLSKTSLQYKWNVEKKKNVFTMLASSMKVDSKITESHYLPQKM